MGRRGIHRVGDPRAGASQEGELNDGLQSLCTYTTRGRKREDGKGEAQRGREKPRRQKGANGKKRKGDSKKGTKREKQTRGATVGEARPGLSGADGQRNKGKGAVAKQNKKRHKKRPGERGNEGRENKGKRFMETEKMKNQPMPENEEAGDQEGRRQPKGMR